MVEALFLAEVMAHVHVGELQPFGSVEIEQAGVKGFAGGGVEVETVYLDLNGEQALAEFVVAFGLGDVAVGGGAIEHDIGEGIGVEHGAGVFVHGFIRVGGGGKAGFYLVDEPGGVVDDVAVHLAEGPAVGMRLRAELFEGVVVQGLDIVVDGLVELF